MLLKIATAWNHFYHHGLLYCCTDTKMTIIASAIATGLLIILLALVSVLLIAFIARRRKLKQQNSGKLMLKLWPQHQNESQWMINEYAHIGNKTQMREFVGKPQLWYVSRVLHGGRWLWDSSPPPSLSLSSPYPLPTTPSPQEYPPLMINILPTLTDCLKTVHKVSWLKLICKKTPNRCTHPNQPLTLRLHVQTY